MAFVKGKVAVYVDDGEPDTSGDDELRAEGWTVLRYRASDVTDGKEQGDEIAAAVKENTKAANKKKKAKKGAGGGSSRPRTNPFPTTIRLYLNANSSARAQSSLYRHSMPEHRG
mgnify:CR=1 FL=1